MFWHSVVAYRETFYLGNSSDILSWQILWHSILAKLLTFYLAYLLTFYLGISSDILCGISSDILCGIYSYILFGISSDCFFGKSSDLLSWHVFWYSIWHIIWHSILETLLTFYVGISSDILSLVPSDILPGISTEITLAPLLAYFLADLLTSYLDMSCDILKWKTGWTTEQRIVTFQNVMVISFHYFRSSFSKCLWYIFFFRSLHSAAANRLSPDSLGS